MPQESRMYKHWQSQGIANTIEGSNYLRAGELRGIIDELERLVELEDTLRQVQTALKSDSIEYDDMRAIDDIINDALEGSSSSYTNSGEAKP
jgi:hypothetical protein